ASGADRLGGAGCCPAPTHPSRRARLRSSRANPGHQEIFAAASIWMVSPAVVVSWTPTRPGENVPTAVVATDRRGPPEGWDAVRVTSIAPAPPTPPPARATRPGANPPIPTAP